MVGATILDVKKKMEKWATFMAPPLRHFIEPGIVRQEFF
jgi:hypothetical protein